MTLTYCFLQKKFLRFFFQKIFIKITNIMYVHLYTPPTSLTNKHNYHKKESDHILIYSPLFIVYLYLIVLSPKSLRSI